MASYVHLVPATPSCLFLGRRPRHRASASQNPLLPWLEEQDCVNTPQAPKHIIVMSSPPPSSSRAGSRLSQIFQRGQSPSFSDRRSDIHESDRGSISQQEGRARAFAKPRAESSSIAGSFSSSLNQKTPARSYYQRPFHGTISTLSLEFNA